MPRLYQIRIDVFESADYPVVTHLFTGKTKKEAWRYHESHRKSDAFLRQCEDKGRFGKDVRCEARITKEGWIG